MKKAKFDFLSSSVYITSVSMIMLLGALLWISFNGFNYGIDFAGGGEVQLKFTGDRLPDTTELRQYLSQKGFYRPSVQSLETPGEFLFFIENPSSTEEEGENEDEKASSFIDQLMEDLQSDFKSSHEASVEILKMESVGPQIGEELRKKGLLAVFYSLIMILIYLGLRFDYKYALASVVCLFHDAVLTMSTFSVFSLVVNVQTLAAILAIIGYSLNDTIVTFDRIRENEDLDQNKNMSFIKLCNQAINEVLSRTLLTSVTTLVAIITMWTITRGVIRDFAFTLGVGVVIGTYSSIYVATPLVVFIDYLSKRNSSKNASPS